MAARYGLNWRTWPFLSLFLLKQWTSSADFVSSHFHHTMPPFHFFQIARSSFIYSPVTNLHLLLRSLFLIRRVLHYTNSRKSLLIVQKLFSQGLFPRRSNVHSILRGGNRQPRGDNIRRALPQTPLLGGG